MLGISSTAPGYTLTATIGLIVTAVLKMHEPENASGGSIFGIGLVFHMGFGILLLGVRR